MGSYDPCVAADQKMVNLTAVTPHAYVEYPVYELLPSFSYSTVSPCLKHSGGILSIYK